MNTNSRRSGPFSTRHRNATCKSYEIKNSDEQSPIPLHNVSTHQVYEPSSKNPFADELREMQRSTGAIPKVFQNIDADWGVFKGFGDSRTPTRSNKTFTNTKQRRSWSPEPERWINDSSPTFNFLYVDQVDEEQKAILIQSSPKFKAFFHEMQFEVEQPFRRVLFNNLTYELFRTLCVILKGGCTLLQVESPDTIRAFLALAQAYEMIYLERYCHFLLQKFKN